MKNFTLTLSLLVFSVAAQCGCPTVTAVMMRSSPTSNHYNLLITFIRRGENFHIEDTIYCNGKVYSLGCNTFDVTGTVNIHFTCSGSPSAKVTPFLGPCGNRNFVCPSVIVGPSAGATPVVLSSFAVKQSGNNIVANWRTEQEINSEEFIIERSLDNKSFEPIGSVISHGNSSIANDYTFVDKTNTSNQPAFYRIQLLDKDGSVAYTGTQTIRRLKGKTDMAVFPNPAYGATNITVTDLNEAATIQVIDNAGRLVKSISLKQSKIVKVSDLVKGNYFIKMTALQSGETIVKKLTIIN